MAAFGFRIIVTGNTVTSPHGPGPYVGGWARTEDAAIVKAAAVRESLHSRGAVDAVVTVEPDDQSK